MTNARNPLLIILLNFLVGFLLPSDIVPHEQRADIVNMLADIVGIAIVLATSIYSLVKMVHHAKTPHIPYPTPPQPTLPQPNNVLDLDNPVVTPKISQPTFHNGADDPTPAVIGDNPSSTTTDYSKIGAI